MFRYLINMSYVGTAFRGSQIQVSRKTQDILDPLTVQGQVEIALKRLDTVSKPLAVWSSRTDAGVHALHATCHVDLETKSGKPFLPYTVTSVMNKYFKEHSVPIQILKTYLVPNTFRSHDAISRTYLYRLVVIKSDRPTVPFVPLEDMYRAHHMCTNTFDVDKMKEASELLLGTHDFRTFMYKSVNVPFNKVTRKTILSIDIVNATPLFYSKMYSWPCCVPNDLSRYRYYDIYISGGGFLHRQVRRTVAALISVAQGKVTTKDIKFMLEIPSHRSWNPVIKTVPAHGLYLCRVEYNRRDTDTFKEE